MRRVVDHVLMAIVFLASLLIVGTRYKPSYGDPPPGPKPIPSPPPPPPRRPSPPAPPRR